MFGVMKLKNLLVEALDKLSYPMCPCWCSNRNKDWETISKISRKCDTNQGIARKKKQDKRGHYSQWLSIIKIRRFSVERWKRINIEVAPRRMAALTAKWHARCERKQVVGKKVEVKVVFSESSQICQDSR